MRIIKRTFQNFSHSTLFLGRAGENLVTKLELDISKELSEYANPFFELILKMPSYDDPYPVEIEVVGGKLYYTFTGSDISTEGYGEVEVLVSDINGEILKSATAKAKINPSIIPNAYPGPLQKVIDDLQAKTVNSIKVVQVLPNDAKNGDVVYLFDDNFYERKNNNWVQIEIGEEYRPVVEESYYNLPVSAQTNDIAFVLEDDYSENDPNTFYPAGTYVYNGQEWSHVKSLNYAERFQAVENMAHTHGNKPTLDKFSGTDAPAFDGHPVSILPVDDIELLQQGETYDELSFAADLEAIPWTFTQYNPYVCIKSINQTYGSEMQIIFNETLSSYSGLPVRMLKVYDVGSEQYWTYASRADGSTPAGWEDDDGNPTDAPSVTEFTPTALVIYDNDTSDYVTYTNFSTMPAKAKEALRVISQVVHTTADRVDNPYTPQDAVIRYVGTIEPNRKYAFRTNYDFTLTLPTMPWQTDDAQFVLYLDCTSAIDITFPTGTRFIGGLPETGAGLHKLIGTWRPDNGIWTVGCVESKAVT